MNARHVTAVLVGSVAIAACARTLLDSSGDGGANDGGANGGNVSSSVTTTCAVRRDGSLWCWGENSDGQVGDGTMTNAPSPVRVGTDATWSAVAVSFGHACAIRTDGSLWCWGRNRYGALGDGTGKSHNVPARVGADSDWTKIAAGGGHTCGIRRDGSLWCWGGPAFGPVVDPPPGATPARRTSYGDWVDVSANWYEACGVRADGSLWCAHDRLPDDAGGIGTYDFTRVIGDGYARIGVGLGHDCAVRKDGTLWCWATFAGVGQMAPVVPFQVHDARDSARARDQRRGRIGSFVRDCERRRRLVLGRRGGPHARLRSARSAVSASWIARVSRRQALAMRSGRATVARPRERRATILFVARRIRIWTWDRGSKLVDMDGPREVVAPILETVLNGGLWRELVKFPPDTLERLLPAVTVPGNVRSVVEIWIEEKRRPAA